ncbi:flavocytochrome c [Telmatospirillum siberiense]|uniref:Flavocytochrome c n=1 Tax=Telmatospirillum siberiense TaxID=382514 RepID=A0A2N3PWY0_9PROT|nr:flavocytochrome c [Telmatospirillum siberiense]PKU24922.1 flavocytochrome c [Telmatospirillum siberiense]
MSNKDLSRRSVLKSVALGAVALSGGTALNMAVPGTAQALVRKLPTQWDETWDVIVIGSGFAGLAAAAEAAGGGAKTTLLEKMPTYGGNSIINGGVFAAWDDKWHYREKLNLGADSPAQHWQDILKGGDYYSIPELAKEVADGAADALNWVVEDGGAELRPTVTRAGGHTAYRTHAAKSGVGREYTEALRKIAAKAGIKPTLNSEVTWIWRADADPKSAVLGVEIKRGKKVLNLRANKAVILASGGFSQNVEMRSAHNPRLTAEYNCTNHKGATGEIHKFAQAVGADTLQMNFIQLYPYAEPETGLLDAQAVYPFNGPGYGILYVTKQGKRFVNELERRDVVAYAQINLGKDAKPTWSIFNEAMILPMGGDPEEVAEGLKRGRFIKAESITELAGKCNIPTDALVDTVNKYIQYHKDGKDPEFNKPITPAMITLEKGPFYAIPQWPAVHFCMGGLRINASGQVIDVFGSPIPKLFAAGEVTGGIHGSNRLGSNAIPTCIVFGRIAGRNALKA